MISSPYRRGIAVAALLMISFVMANAGDVTARIKGTVADPSGAVLANVTVTATNVATGVITTTISQKNGDYQFLNLPLGTYTVSAAASGFKSFSASGISLSIDEQYVEPIVLSLGSSSETVEIQADAVQVDTSSMQLSNIVDASQIVDYPLIGRAFTSLEAILPGVQASSDRFGSNSVNGAQTQQSSYLINGADTNDFALNTIGIQPNIDALSEFNLVTGSLNAEYSRNSGAIVSTAVKTGANKFHGDIFEFYRDTFLNNHNFFQATAPVYHQNVFGGTLGGPIYKDKLFFFGAYQGTRARTPQATQSNILLSQAQLSGDFSASTFTPADMDTNPDGTLVDPVTGRIPGTINIPGCTAGEPYTQCFANGQVPVGGFNPISVALNKKYAPNSLINAPGNTYNLTPIQTRTQDQGILRLDFNPTSKDQITFVGIYQHFPTADGIPFTGATVLGFGDQNTSEIRQITGSYGRQLNSTTLNEFLVHYTRFNFGSVVPQSTQLPSASGFDINPQDVAAASLPTIAVSGYFTLGFSTNGPQPRVDQNIQLDDNFSKVIGHHTLKFGYDGRRFTVDNEFNNSNSGSYGFSTGGPLTTGDAGLDYLLGIPSSYSQGAGGRIDARAYENYVYAQDTWKATNSLVVNVGMGYQIDTAIHNLQFGRVGVNCFVPYQQSKIFPTAPLSLAFPGDPGCNDAQGATVPYKDFGPRIGVAFTPNLGILSDGNSKKLSVRAGYGIYYNRTEEEGSLQNLGDAPFGVNSAGVTDYDGTAIPQFGNPYADIQTGTAYTNKFPASFPKPGDKTVNFDQFGPLYISGYNPGYRAPYSENFNLTIERELPGQIVANVSYVGTLGRHNQITIEGNPITKAGHDLCLASSTCSLTSERNFQASLDPSHTTYPQAINPAFGSTSFHSVSLISTEGSSNYNSLQLSAKKGPTHGLAGQFSYTYSHSLDNTSSYEGSGFGGERGYNQFNKTLNYGNSGFDARHRLVLAPIYSVPFSNSGSAFSLRNIVASGWTISGVSTFATGFPFDISYQGGTSRSLYCANGDFYYTCPDVPNLIAPLKRTDPRALTKNLATGGTYHAFFDGNILSAAAPNASFGPEAIGSFGNITRNKFHGPGSINTDAEIAKRIRYSSADTAKIIELRLEAYNVFNHTNFNNPSGNYLSNLGRISSAAAGRQVQLGAKIYF
jgi:hypothetical protein